MKLRVSAVIVWLLCVSLQAGVMSATFVHFHADTDHAADHHDGRQIHRHGPAGHEHDSEPESDGDQPSPSLSPVPGLDVRRVDVDHVQPPQTLPAVSATLVVPALRRAHPHPVGVESPPDGPDLRTSTPRGPPVFFVGRRL